jgi:hypothetical protein
MGSDEPMLMPVKGGLLVASWFGQGLVPVYSGTRLILTAQRGTWPCTWCSSCRAHWDQPTAKLKATEVKQPRWIDVGGGELCVEVLAQGADLCIAENLDHRMTVSLPVDCGI